MVAAQEQLKNEEVEASAGGGMVTVKVSGDLVIKAITIAPEAIDPDDPELLQDMVLAATNEALRAAQELQQAKLGGLDGRHGPGLAGPAGLLAALVLRRPSNASSPSWASCPASASARLSAWPSTSCAATPRTRPRWPTRSARSRSASGCARSASTWPTSRAAGICQDERRDASLICVVEEPGDVIPIERTHEYRGRYHVLGGALSPIDGIDPEDLKIAELYARVRNGSRSARSSSRPTRRRPARRPRCTSPRPCASARPTSR